MKAFLMASVGQVTARSEARAVGMLAFRKAAWERQREESLLQSRRKLASELSSVTDPEQAAVLLAKPLSTRFAGSDAVTSRLQSVLRVLLFSRRRAEQSSHHDAQSHKQSAKSHA